MKKRSILFALPAFLIYTALMVIPMLIVFFFSVTNYNGMTSNFRFVGIKNFIELVSDERFLNASKMTLIITLVVVIVVNILGLILAILLDKAKSFTNLFRSVFFIPVLMSSVAISFAWNALLSYTGVINTVISQFGFEPHDFFGVKSNAIACIIIVEIWRNLGFYMVIYLAHLQTVPKDLYEACTIDGGNTWDKFTNVTIPMIVPGITICTLLSVMNGLKLFDTPMILTGGGPGFDTETIVLTVFKRAFGSNEIGYGSAMSLILFITIVVISMIQLRISKKAEVEN